MLTENCKKPVCACDDKHMQFNLREWRRVRVRSHVLNENEWVKLKSELLKVRKIQAE